MKPHPWETIRVHRRGSVFRLAFNRDEHRNALSAGMVREIAEALDTVGDECRVVVLSGGTEFFSAGADLADRSGDEGNPSDLYDIWCRLHHGPFVSIAHVEGQASGGGVGFTAACDLVVASPQATFSLPELAYGLVPAMVTPFLVDRVGWQRARHLTLAAATVDAARAKDGGLVDECASDSAGALRQLVIRIAHLPSSGVGAYKSLVQSLEPQHADRAEAAIATNRAVFTDVENRARISEIIALSGSSSR